MTDNESIKEAVKEIYRFFLIACYAYIINDRIYMKIIDITEALGKKFPLYYQEDFDNSGSQILFKDEQLKGVYVCLDVSLETVEDAVRNHCNLIISHHPLIFRPIKNIISDDVRSRIIVRLMNQSPLYFL
jgi:putative NIF3 family GTP cyclohydrolase 1 type 2